MGSDVSKVRYIKKTMGTYATRDPGNGKPLPKQSRPSLFIAQTTNAEAVPYNPSRSYLLIQNQSANVIYYEWGTNATVDNSFQLAAGTEIAFEEPGSEALHILGSAANSNVKILEL